MVYEKRLLLAKFMVIAAYLMLIWGQANIAFEAYAPTLYFVIGCGSFLIALILLWSRLHGTGRSVRMASYYGVVLLIAPIVTVSFLNGDNAGEYDAITLIPPPLFMALSFILFCVAMLISIKRT